MRGLEAVLREARGELPEGLGWRIAMQNQIPLARGLGSSAAATVGGVLAGNTLAGEPLSTTELLRIATDDRGPPRQRRRRAARRVRRVGASGTDGVEAIRFDVAARPARRAVHPRAPSRDGRHALGAADIGAAGRRGREPGCASRSAWPGLATGRYDLLARLTVDRLHEPYRAAVYPQLPRMVEAARAAGAIGACLSGAGSTIIAFTDGMAGITRLEAAFFAAAADTDLTGRVLVVEPRNTGARVASRS